MWLVFQFPAVAADIVVGGPDWPDCSLRGAVDNANGFFIPDLNCTLAARGRSEFWALAESSVGCEEGEHRSWPTCKLLKEGWLDGRDGEI